MKRQFVQPKNIRRTFNGTLCILVNDIFSVLFVSGFYCNIHDK